MVNILSNFFHIIIFIYRFTKNEHLKFTKKLFVDLHKCN